MECSVCLYNFDSGTHLPLALPCGHTLCKECVDSFLKANEALCPFDRKDFSDSEFIKPNYDLIEILKTEDSVTDSLRCCNGHPINESVSITAFCDMCREKSVALWFCLTCQYGICDVCKEWYSSSTIIKEYGLRCFRNHPLRLTQNTEKYYDRNGKVLCDGCEQLFRGQSAHCRNCMIDYCMDCYTSLIELIQIAVNLKCKCGKQTVWRSNQPCKKCKKCCKAYNKSGAFICLECGLKYCIRCSYFNIARSCESVPN
jgi:Ring finger domain